MNASLSNPAAWWPQLRAGVQRQRRAFDARARRERMLLIAVVGAAAFSLSDALWLSPALKTWDLARKQHVQAEGALKGLRTDIERHQASGSAVQAQTRTDVLQWRSRVREGDAALREHAAKLVGPEHMLQLLEQMLTRQGQVRVRAMRSLGKTELSVAVPGSAASAPAGGSKGLSASATVGSSVAGPTLYRHGVELTLEGSFADLLSYLHAIEDLPQRVLWGGMQFRVEQYPKAVLTLKVYTLSLDRHWLEI